MKNLKLYRTAKGLTQAEVARALNISRQAYYNYETGKREADYETLLKLSELFDTSIESLIRDDAAEILAGITAKADELKKEKAPDDKVRGSIIEIVRKLDDDQAKRLLDFLDTFVQG